MAIGQVIIVLGPQGAGKETQSRILAKRLDGVCLSSGELLRWARPRYADMAAVMAEGQLVDTGHFCQIMTEAIDAVAPPSPIIFDGVTRLPEEVPWLLEELKRRHRELRHVIYLKISEATSRQRVAERQHGRPDDDPSKQATRWRLFQEQTLQSIDHYRRLGLLREIDGEASVETVARAIATAIGY